MSNIVINIKEFEVYHMKLFLRVEEVTGIWMDCDTNANLFSRCLFHQATDDDHDLDSHGVLSEKGSARIYSVPQHQWGERCLSIRLQSSSMITVSIYGSYLKNENSTYSNVFEPDVTYFQETIGLNKGKIVNLLASVLILILIQKTSFKIP